MFRRNQGFGVPAFFWAILAVQIGIYGLIAWAIVKVVIWLTAA